MGKIQNNNLYNKMKNPRKNKVKEDLLLNNIQKWSEQQNRIKRKKSSL